jgi:hypothetical protein
VFNLSFSKSSIAYIELVQHENEIETQLWLASCNMVIVVNERTLGIMKTFEVTTSQFDHILMLKSSKYGIWCSIRGSNIIHLFDKKTFTCKLLMDIKKYEHPDPNKVRFYLKKNLLIKKNLMKTKIKNVNSKIFC